MNGFRLQRYEVLNWGTFHQQIWHLDVNRRNALVTGDIGSGKSTLLDGLTTLLVNPQRFTYNKAAGAEHKERDRRSYVLGYYKSDNNSVNGSAKPVALRDVKSHSVLLAVFTSPTEQVTLAQVFWCTDQHSQPERLYVVANQTLSIKEHFTRFPDMTTLRKRLRDMQDLKTHDSFTAYSDDFCRRLGIPSEQAMDLFAQTVSMKEAGNLTEFVREHMLDPCEVQPRIDALLANFDVLQQSYQKVLDAREQIRQLEPLVATSNAYREREERVTGWQQEKQAIPAWFAERKVVLLRTRQSQLAQDLALGQERLARISDQLRHENDEQRRLAVAISRAGGGRLDDLKREVGSLSEELNRRTQAASDYRTFAAMLGLAMPDSDEQFHAQLTSVRERQRLLSQTSEDLITKRMARVNDEARMASEDEELRQEMLSLAERPSNIDSKWVAIRRQMCQDLTLPIERLPFAGELIRVLESEHEWEPAIERVLGGFAKSMLVPADLHTAVSEWVNTHHLGLRLVLNRFGAVNRIPSSSRPQSLVRKVEVKPGEAHDWVRAELAGRFDYACCDTPAECHRMGRGVTRQGYTSHNETRSEKDDRTRIGDRTHYQLGWSTREKIAELQRQRDALREPLAALRRDIATLKQQYKDADNNRTALDRLAMVLHFSQIDAASTAANIATKKTEIVRLEEADEPLKELNRQLAESEQRADGLKKEDSRLTETAGSIKTQLENVVVEMAQVTDLVAGITSAMREDLWPRLEKQVTGQLSLSSIAQREREMLRALDKQVDTVTREMTDLRDQLVGAMKDFCRTWMIEAQELDANIAAAPAFVKLLERLQTDRLPDFIERFRTALHENTFRGMAQFKHALDTQEEDIEERINLINRSLKDIEYGRDYGRIRYIQLVKSDNFDADVMDFKRDLRTCFQNALGSSSVEDSEAKFLQIRTLLDRLRGRPESAEPDARWRMRVTDVRNWFQFGASERWQDTDEQHEFHPGSSGKSGGQKEKLAYTVLAASLAFQYRIHDVDRPRGFRFVIIDEAFGKGSDESVRYGLELFAKLDLQLLIATPMQKIAPIEPFVCSVSYVHNVEGRDSRVRHLTVEEVRAMRQAPS